jgi:hypothetical protein
MLFDDPELYFTHDSDRYYQQGDIVLAPMVVLESGNLPASAATGRPAVGDLLLNEVWDEPPLAGESGRLVSSVCLCPVVITTHDCTLDKEFNRCVDALRTKQGMQLNAAIRAAANDLSLDRYINVAPVVPLSHAAPSGPAELRQNKVVGYFPVVEDDDRGIDAGVVDLLRETTIDRDLIVARLAVLSDEARAALRYSLARYWVYRAPKIGFELEDAIGRRIKDVAISGEGTLGIELALDNGSTLRFVQAPHTDDPGPERPGLSSAD